jgi:hypothetical protein
MSKNKWYAGLALLGMIASGQASGQQSEWSRHPALHDRWMFQLGAYAPNVKTSASLNGTGGVVNRAIDFEDDLNLTDRKVMPALLASVRLGERWRIEAEYFSLHRSGSRAVSRTISWGDNTYTAGTVVSSEFDSDIYRLSGGYSFIKDDRRELGVALGLHVTDFRASLSASGGRTQAGDTLAPLPTLGVYGAYAFTPRWLLSGRLDYFSVKVDDYDGVLVNFQAGVDYRFSRHVGVGLAWRHVDYDVDVTRARYTGNISYKFSGPMLYVNASF